MFHFGTPAPGWDEMIENGTPGMRILRRSTDRPVFASIAPSAGFTSQAMLRREPPRAAPEAARAYLASAKAGVRRLPPGYRTTRLA